MRCARGKEPGYGGKRGGKATHAKALDLKLTLSFSIREWDVANPIWRKAMHSKKERLGKVSKRRAVATAGAALALLIAGGEAAGLVAQNSPALVNQEKQVAAAQSKFYCNTRELAPEDAAPPRQLSAELTAQRQALR